ncbi:CCAAT/enhancer-binding protein zeta [Phytophthora citrophthora]|uniref:CCAAT/enhancer-binding protein zeta n=1 Tax=Phytophthora citrophthora TaxID=4793 RepID=A0AAD9G0Y5_9STRA|nr:CCAAT/enhancer-binding protein zeta [Phytophthora citrophthora]
MDRKLLSALMVGVNRAFPYVNAIASANFAEEIDSLFQVMHRAHHSTSVQPLMLMFQIMNSTNSASDQFYTALYGKLIYRKDPSDRCIKRHSTLVTC